MLSVANKPLTFSVVMLNVVMLSVIVLSVVAPYICLGHNNLANLSL
jgi:hypothetical protein